jgi:tricorn protease
VDHFHYRKIISRWFLLPPSLWGCYTLEGDDLEQIGVAPTIPVEMNFKHRQDGEDPQLRRAIEEVMRK